jgi:predicted Zn-dependent protease
MRKLSVVLLSFLLVASCAVNPVTGKKELSLISEAQEIEIGKQSDTEIRAEFGVYPDAALEAYIAAAGTAMASRSHRTNLTFHFAVLDSPVINAFAAPGGYVYVTRGLLALVSSEDELAGVLGHEIGHVTARHSVRQMSNQVLVQAGLMVGSVLSETFAKYSGLAGVGAQLLFLKFSRDDERQADALGVEYSRRAGYNPGSMVDFFAAMQKSGDLSGKSTIPGFLSTHPLTEDRIRDVKAQVTAEDARLAHNPEAYLQKIQNLVYGEDPRQGFVEGSAFYHPDLRFEFSIPSGWKLVNTPVMVQMAPADGNAMLVLQAEKSADGLKDYAGKRAGEFQNSRLLDDRSQTSNDLSCYEQSYSVPQENQSPVRLVRSFIKKGDLIYTFSALSPEPKFSSYQPGFRSTVGSFRNLTDSAYLNRTAKRLALVRADGGTAIQEIFRKEGMAQNLWPQFAIMNGMEAAAVPAKGKLLKVLR